MFFKHFFPAADMNTTSTTTTTVAPTTPAKVGMFLFYPIGNIVISTLLEKRLSVCVSVSISIDARSVLENGYDTDAWCELYMYKSIGAITNINADAQCG